MCLSADEAEDEPPPTRLEDLSEDDFDGGAESDDSDVARMQEQLAEQKRCPPQLHTFQKAWSYETHWLHIRRSPWLQACLDWV